MASNPFTPEGLAIFTLGLVLSRVLERAEKSPNETLDHVRDVIYVTVSTNASPVEQHALRAGLPWLERHEAALRGKVQSFLKAREKRAKRGRRKKARRP